MNFLLKDFQQSLISYQQKIYYLTKDLIIDHNTDLNISDKLEIKFLPIMIGYFSELVLTINLIGLINIYDFFSNLLFCKILTIYFI